MASVVALSGNDQPDSGLSHFLHRVDELTITFSHSKIRHCYAESQEFISEYFKSCLKLIEEIRVWPPSTDNLVAELTLVCNCLVVGVAQKIHLRCRSASVCMQLDSLVCDTVTRVLQLALRVPVVPGLTPENETDIELAVKKIVIVVKDPLLRFRLLDSLARLVLLCCLCCVYTRQKAGLEKTQSLLVSLDQLVKTVGKSVLEDTFPYKQGLILCKDDNCKQADLASICVGDVVRLVTLSSELTVESGSLQHREWQWLDTFLQCKELIKKDQSVLAMKKLEIQLSQPLDPETKAILLSQFAKCYQKQGYPQLAIQTYKDALQVFNEHHSVLLHLADIYNTVGQHELKLEILNLLVKVLSAKSVRNERVVFTTNFEAIVMSVFQVMPRVTLLNAVHSLAKCCTQLHRYKEAAEHYIKLLDLLKNVENLTLDSASDEPLLKADVRELVVETIETLALAQRHSECLSLCDEFFPILSTEGTLPHLSQHIRLDADREDSAHSQHSLFGHSQRSSSSDETINCSLERQPSYSSVLLSVKQKNNDSISLTSGILENLSSLSRKRNRSTSFDQDGDSDKNFVEDKWWSRSLPVRLLLSKSDALVAVQGFTDEVVGCLKLASSLLIVSDTSIFDQDKDILSSPSQPPFKKCKYIKDSHTSETSDTAAKEKSSEQIESSSEFRVSKTWANFMVKVALSMAKIYLERNRTSSVLNSCHLVLQLEPHNIFAHYLKSVALQKLSHQKHRAAKQWLQERGFDLSSVGTALPLILDEKQKEIRKKRCEINTHSSQWWEISELCLLDLDVVSLNIMAEHMEKQPKTT